MNQNDREPDLARVASLIGEPARATMLAALLGGEPLPAGTLAARARVSPSTASEHLARLVAGGLVTRRVSGRHRYYALSNEDVAAALEALARISPLVGDDSGCSAAAGDALRFARTCYDHLAGELGVLVTDTLVVRGLVSRRGYEVTEVGEAWLYALGIDVSALRAHRRPMTRPCLDWSERRDHLAGSVGAALATTLLERRWLVRLDGTRAVRLTLRGREGLYRTLGLEV
jgi:DNA-binding transcriptional ArsR family regulator